MPQVDTAYVIGVIREKEKGLLQDDEYTRIIQAPTGEEAVRALVDTPYGIHLEQTGSIFDAITAHLSEEMRWLREVVDNEDVISFLTARYDGLHIARALVKFRAGKGKPGHVESPSSLGHTLLSSVIWDNQGLEDIPLKWRLSLQHELELIKSGEWTTSGFLKRTGEQVITVMQETAEGELMAKLADLAEQHLNLDAALRPQAIEFQAADIQAPNFLSQTAIEAVQTNTSAMGYEGAWDEAIIGLIRQERSNPIGYSPIVAYWYAKEIEARSLRLILSAKLGGEVPTVIQALKRPLYLAV